MRTLSMLIVIRLCFSLGKNTNKKSKSNHSFLQEISIKQTLYCTYCKTCYCSLCYSFSRVIFASSLTCFLISATASIKLCSPWTLANSYSFSSSPNLLAILFISFLRMFFSCIHLSCSIARFYLLSCSLVFSLNIAIRS